MKRTLWLLVSTCLWIPGAALAQGAAAPAHRALDVTGKVDRHDAAAKQAYRAQRYDEALREYEEAYRLSQEPIFVFNIAQVQRARGSYREALARYEQFLELERDASSPARQQAVSYIRDVKVLLELQERERAAKEREQLARERERLAREREQLARERERAVLAREQDREARSAAVDDRRGRGFRAKLAVSPSFRSLYGTTFLGGDFGLMLGGQIPRLGIFFSLDYFVGSTLSAMQTMAVRPGLTLEGILGRWRVGGSVYLSILAVHRLTASSYLLDGGGGVSVHGSRDLVLWGERAFYGGLRLGVDGLTAVNDSGARSVMVDLTALLGFRL